MLGIAFQDFLIARRPEFLVFLLGLFLVIAATLGSLSPEQISSRDDYALGLSAGIESASEITENILLFVPLAFGLAGCLRRNKNFSRIAVLVVVVSCSLGFSYVIEVLQSFLPSRFPSWTDVASNTTGGLIGGLCFWLWESRNLKLFLIAYLATAFLVSIPLQRNTALSNWDASYPLVLGNEGTGDRPWYGSISELFIADRAISAEEVGRILSQKNPTAVIGHSLSAYYRLEGKGRFEDQTGRLPDLIWKGATGLSEPGAGKVLLSSERWLQTKGPALSLNRELKQASQFTLGVTVASMETGQTGPARIVSLSQDAMRRNFTLGQDGSDLIFRLRTPLTGLNAGEPRLRVPDFFSKLDTHRLVVTYDGSTLLFYSDGNLNSEALGFSPGTPFFTYFLSYKAGRLPVYKSLYYALIFVPLGILLSLTIRSLDKRSLARILGTAAGGILMASLILEGILMSLSGRMFDFDNLLLSAAFAVGALVLCHLLATALERLDFVILGYGRSAV